ncbi:hypothetical protein AGMMS50276_25360 [Synergistales bacterium]|nr:hypothetical protein AGMMS50276_25360 [Synergistales bacterium]
MVYIEYRSTKEGVPSRPNRAGKALRGEVMKMKLINEREGIFNEKVAVDARWSSIVFYYPWCWQ